MLNSRLRRGGAFPFSLGLTVISSSQAPILLLERNRNWELLATALGARAVQTPRGWLNQGLSTVGGGGLGGQECELQVPPGIKCAECRWGSRYLQLSTADAQVHKGP